jgi:hypothetical protein
VQVVVLPGPGDNAVGPNQQRGGRPIGVRRGDKIEAVAPALHSGGCRRPEIEQQRRTGAGELRDPQPSSVDGHGQFRHEVPDQRMRPGHPYPRLGASQEPCSHNGSSAGRARSTAVGRFAESARSGVET